MSRKPGSHDRFILVRQGQGTVAEGIEWSDGTVSFRWCTEKPSMTVDADCVADVEAVQCGDGKTAVVWDF